MGNEQKIKDKIISDANEEAKKIMAQAKKESDIIINSANEKAQKELASYRKQAEDDADKAAAKEISGAEMAAKKQILAKKQQLLEEVIEQARQKLLNLSDKEYKDVIFNMISNAEEGNEIIFSKKDKERLSSFLEKKGINVSDETRNISGGFIVKKGDIEYNYSFESIIAVEKEYIEQIAAEILFN